MTTAGAFAIPNRKLKEHRFINDSKLPEIRADILRFYLLLTVPQRQTHKIRASHIRREALS